MRQGASDSSVIPCPPYPPVHSLHVGRPAYHTAHPVHSFWPSCPAWLALSDIFKLRQSPHLGIEIMLRYPEVEPGGNFPLATPGYLAGHSGHLAVLDESRLSQLPGMSGSLISLTCHVVMGELGTLSSLWLRAGTEAWDQFCILWFFFFFLWPWVGFMLIKYHFLYALQLFLNGPLLSLLSKGDCSIYQNSPERTIMEMKPSGDVIISRFHFKSMGHVKPQTSLSTLINYKVFLCFTKLFIGSFKAVVIILSWNVRATYLPRKQWLAWSF